MLEDEESLQREQNSEDVPPPAPPENSTREPDIEKEKSESASDASDATVIQTDAVSDIPDTAGDDPSAEP